MDELTDAAAGPAPPEPDSVAELCALLRRPPAERSHVDRERVRALVRALNPAVLSQLRMHHSGAEGGGEAGHGEGDAALSEDDILDRLLAHAACVALPPGRTLARPSAFPERVLVVAAGRVELLEPRIVAAADEESDEDEPNGSDPLVSPDKPGRRITWKALSYGRRISVERPWRARVVGRGACIGLLSLAQHNARNDYEATVYPRPDADVEAAATPASAAQPPQRPPPPPARLNSALERGAGEGESEEEWTPGGWAWVLAIPRAAALSFLVPSYRRTLQQRMTLLRNTAIFKTWAQEALGQLCDRLTQRTLRPDEVLFRQNDPAEFCFLVISGGVDVCVHTHARPPPPLADAPREGGALARARWELLRQCTSRGGAHARAPLRLVSTLHAGALVGEAALLTDGLRRNATVMGSAAGGGGGGGSGAQPASSPAAAASAASAAAAADALTSLGMGGAVLLLLSKDDLLAALTERMLRAARAEAAFNVACSKPRADRTDADVSALYERVHALPLFARLPEASTRELCRGLTYARVGAGVRICAHPKGGPGLGPGGGGGAAAGGAAAAGAAHAGTKAPHTQLGFAATDVLVMLSGQASVHVHVSVNALTGRLYSHATIVGGAGSGAAGGEGGEERPARRRRKGVTPATAALAAAAVAANANSARTDASGDGGDGGGGTADATPPHAPRRRSELGRAEARALRLFEESAQVAEAARAFAGAGATREGHAAAAVATLAHGQSHGWRWETVERTAGAGDSINEAAAALGDPPDSSARALGPVEVLAISRAAYRAHGGAAAYAAELEATSAELLRSGLFPGPRLAEQHAPPGLGAAARAAAEAELLRIAPLFRACSLRRGQLLASERAPAPARALIIVSGECRLTVSAHDALTHLREAQQAAETSAMLARMRAPPGSGAAAAPLPTVATAASAAATGVAAAAAAAAAARPAADAHADAAADAAAAAVPAASAGTAAHHPHAGSPLPALGALGSGARRGSTGPPAMLSVTMLGGGNVFCAATLVGLVERYAWRLDAHTPLRALDIADAELRKLLRGVGERQLETRGATMRAWIATRTEEVVRAAHAASALSPPPRAAAARALGSLELTPRARRSRAAHGARAAGRPGGLDGEGGGGGGGDDDDDVPRARAVPGRAPPAVRSHAAQQHPPPPRAPARSFASATYAAPPGAHHDASQPPRGRLHSVSRGGTVRSRPRRAAAAEAGAGRAPTGAAAAGAWRGAEPSPPLPLLTLPLPSVVSVAGRAPQPDAAADSSSLSPGRRAARDMHRLPKMGVDPSRFAPAAPLAAEVDKRRRHFVYATDLLIRGYS